MTAALVVVPLALALAGLGVWALWLAYSEREAAASRRSAAPPTGGMPAPTNSTGAPAPRGATVAPRAPTGHTGWVSITHHSSGGAMGYSFMSARFGAGEILAPITQEPNTCTLVSQRGACSLFQCPNVRDAPPFPTENAGEISAAANGVIRATMLHHQYQGEAAGQAGSMFQPFDAITVHADGGDVPPFSQVVIWPPAVPLSALPAPFSRSADLTIQFDGGQPPAVGGEDRVIGVVLRSAGQTGIAPRVSCSAPVSARSLTIPSSLLTALASGPMMVHVLSNHVVTFTAGDYTIHLIAVTTTNGTVLAN